MTLQGTNSWVIGTRRGAVVIDPGPADPAHIAAVSGNLSVCAILLTHRHPDHVDGLSLLRPDVPVYAADPQLARGTDPLRDGDRLDFQTTVIEVLTTPGHTEDSVCFQLGGQDKHLVLTGDTLLGGQRSTFVSRDSAGDLGALLNSLRRLSTSTGVTGLPGHGENIADMGMHAASALHHRLRRLDALEKTLRAARSADVDEMRRCRSPRDDPQREAAVRWMLHVEREFLIETGRIRRAPAASEGLPPGGPPQRDDPATRSMLLARSPGGGAAGDLLDVPTREHTSKMAATRGERGSQSE